MSSGFESFTKKVGDGVCCPPAGTKPLIRLTRASKAQSREPSPNRGASVPELEAIPQHRESQAAWRERNGIDAAKQIRLVKVAHMRYRHPDLSLITTFLRDFGMHVVKKTETQVWFKGYGTDQCTCILLQIFSPD